MGLDIFFERRSKAADMNAYQEACDAENALYEDKRYNADEASVTNAKTEEERAAARERVTETRREATKKREELNPWSEAGYFRKVNFLLPFFEYEENCSRLEINKEQVEELISRCRQVIENHSLAEELLPTESGFFFGNTEYSDWYFEDVNGVRDTFEKILKETDWDNEIVSMYCWW